MNPDLRRAYATTYSEVYVTTYLSRGLTSSINSGESKHSNLIIMITLYLILSVTVEPLKLWDRTAELSEMGLMG